MRLPALIVCAFLLCLAPLTAHAQKKPKRALSERDARRAIAAMPGFALSTGAVRVREISVAGVEPVEVVAEVTTAIRFVKKDGETGAQTRWRASELRTGDRNWEEFDLLAQGIGAERIAGARAALESLVTEYEARQRARAAAETKADETKSGENKRDEKKTGEKKAGETEAASDAEVAGEGLRLRQFSPLGSSAVGEFAVEATFRLSTDAARKWHVVALSIGGVTSGDLRALLASINSQKNERARLQLETIRTALEAFRRERGFYVVAKDEAALMDHLSPRYIESIIRLDPWLRPLRYEGTRDRFVLRSDGADGLAGTPDDLVLGSPP